MEFSLQPRTNPRGVFDGFIARYELQDMTSIESLVLKHKYITLTPKGYESKESPYYKKIKYMTERLEDLVRIELLKLPGNDRPTQYSSIMSGIYWMGGIKFDTEPKDWTYYDEELVELIKKVHDDLDAEKGKGGSGNTNGEGASAAKRSRRS
jgi:hypothetical protein